jgi:hypothetical protein
MLSGKRFRLGNPTLALDVVDGKRVANVTFGITFTGHLGRSFRSASTKSLLRHTQTFDVTVRGTEIKDAGYESLSRDMSATG